MAKDKKNNKVISLGERLERWQHVYTSPRGEFQVTVSSRGFLKVSFRDGHKDPIFLDFFESVRFMSDISKGFEQMVVDAT